MLEVDGEQHDERTAEHEPRNQQRARAVVPPAKGEHRGRQRFHDRVPRRNRRAARAAAPAKEREAHDGNVLEPRRGRARSSCTPRRATRSTCLVADDRCRRSGSCRSAAPKRAANTSAIAPVITLSFPASLGPEPPLRFGGQREERRRLRQPNAPIGRQLVGSAARIQRERRETRAHGRRSPSRQAGCPSAG